MGKAKKILKKLVTEGDMYLYSDVNEVTGMGLDYSWVFLTQEEAEYLRELIDGE